MYVDDIASTELIIYQIEKYGNGFSIKYRYNASNGNSGPDLSTRNASTQGEELYIYSRKPLQIELKQKYPVSTSDSCYNHFILLHLFPLSISKFFFISARCEVMWEEQKKGTPFIVFILFLLIFVYIITLDNNGIRRCAPLQSSKSKEIVKVYLILHSNKWLFWLHILW